MTTLVRRIAGITKGNLLLYVAAIVASGLATLFNMTPAMLLSIVIDSVLNQQALDNTKWLSFLVMKIGGPDFLRDKLWICGAALLLLTGLSSFFDFLRGYWSAKASEGIAKRLKDNLYSHLQKLPYDYHVKAQTGDLIQRCTSDVDTIRRFLAGDVVELARTVFIVVFALALMLSIHVWYALAAVCLIPLLFWFSYVYFKRIVKAFKIAEEKEGELSTVLQESVSGIRVVRAFGREAYEMNRFEKQNAEFRDIGVNLAHMHAHFWSTSDFMTFIQVGVTLLFGTYLALKGEISVGTLMMFISYEWMLIWPVRHLGRMLSDMGRTDVAMHRVYDILDTPEEQDTEGAADMPLNGDIVFDNVYYAYEKDKPVLNGLSLRIGAGQTVAFLGATGSGKSTIMHLLLRLYDYQGGAITIGGTDIRNIRKHCLRERIGLVLQEPFLYSKTIRENIRMARHTAGDADIYEATTVAAVHDVIEEFQEGYETMVGERGVTLSGGQKQRVAIARTLIKNSDVLVFDDSLSAVDSETDLQIRTAQKEKRKDATTIIISQRIMTLMEADTIFVLEKGRIADMGTHEELITRPGLYQRIWQIQTMMAEEFEEEEMA